MGQLVRLSQLVEDVGRHGHALVHLSLGIVHRLPAPGLALVVTVVKVKAVQVLVDGKGERGRGEVFSDTP